MASITTGIFFTLVCWLSGGSQISLSSTVRSDAARPEVVAVTPDETGSEFEISLKGVEPGDRIVEILSFESDRELASHLVDPQRTVTTLTEAGDVRVSTSRFDGQRDRLDSRFVVYRTPTVVSTPRYVTSLENIARDTTPLPLGKSRKGLQVQMIDDAISLGIQHATLNVNLAGLIAPNQSEGVLLFECSGKTYQFHESAIRALDQQVSQLSVAEVQVYLILLNYLHPDPTVDRIMRHPKCPQPPLNNISAFNLATEEGVDWYRACCRFLADRYSGPSREFGRVVGYIVGNEVNSHSYWYAMGSAEPAEVMDEYHRAMRISHAAVRFASSTARVYVSLDHFWTGSIHQDRTVCFGGREVIDRLLELSHEQGDFDWHVAHHPYPENLFEPRSWNDGSATESPDSVRITFRNLGQLTQYLSAADRRYEGQIRRVILSEQGFHSPANTDGEIWQAAGFCYAWVRVNQLDGIDAFILHRHVDHQHEGGLNLGLWTRQPDSIATPARKKKIYDVFLHADQPDWATYFEFSLPVIGIRDWRELAPNSGQIR